VALKQVGVVGRGEDGAAGGLQAGQVGEGGELLGLGEQGGGAEGWVEDLEGGALTPDPVPGGSGEDVVDSGGAAVEEAWGGGGRGDAIGDAVDGQFVVDVEAHRTFLLQGAPGNLTKLPNSFGARRSKHRPGTYLTSVRIYASLASNACPTE
jgi:hypothetical protein